MKLRGLCSFEPPRHASHLDRIIVLVSVEQLPEVLARLRGEDAPEAAPAESPAAAPSDPVQDMTRGYPEVEGSSDEDAWNLTDRE